MDRGEEMGGGQITTTLYKGAKQSSSGLLLQLVFIIRLNIGPLYCASGTS